MGTLESILVIVIIVIQLIILWRLVRSSQDKSVADLKNDLSKIEQIVRSEFVTNRSEIRISSREDREEQSRSFKSLSDEQGDQLRNFSVLLNDLSLMTEQKVEKLIGTNENSLRSYEEKN